MNETSKFGHVGESRPGNKKEKRKKRIKRVKSELNQGNQKKYLRNNYGRYRAVITRVEGAPLSWCVAVLNPNWRITDNKSAFCTGFDKEAAKSVLAEFSDPL